MLIHCSSFRFLALYCEDFYTSAPVMLIVRIFYVKLSFIISTEVLQCLLELSFSLLKILFNMPYHKLIIQGDEYKLIT